MPTPTTNHIHTQSNDPRIKKKAGQPPKLAIIDPNRPDNDISAGSVQVLKIFKEFAAAFDALQKRMAELHSGTSKDPTGSILGLIYNGNYDSFMRQRAHLWALYSESLEKGYH